MSADLPEMGHAGGLAMARVLVTYMDNPKAIKRAIKGEFERAPDLRTIERMRLEYLTSLVPEHELQFKPAKAWKAHEGYRPDEIRERARVANQRFLAALAAERRAA